MNAQTLHLTINNVGIGGISPENIHISYRKTSLSSFSPDSSFSPEYNDSTPRYLTQEIRPSISSSNRYIDSGRSAVSTNYTSSARRHPKSSYSSSHVSSRYSTAPKSRHFRGAASSVADSTFSKRTAVRAVEYQGWSPMAHRDHYCRAGAASLRNPQTQAAEDRYNYRYGNDDEYDDVGPEDSISQFSSKDDEYEEKRGRPRKRAGSLISSAKHSSYRSVPALIPEERWLEGPPANGGNWGNGVPYYTRVIDPQR